MYVLLAEHDAITEATQAMLQLARHEPSTASASPSHSSHGWQTP